MVYSFGRHRKQNLDAIRFALLECRVSHILARDDTKIQYGIFVHLTLGKLVSLKLSNASEYFSWRSLSLVTFSTIHMSHSQSWLSSLYLSTVVPPWAVSSACVPLNWPPMGQDPGWNCVTLDQLRLELFRNTLTKHFGIISTHQMEAAVQHN